MQTALGVLSVCTQVPALLKSGICVMHLAERQLEPCCRTCRDGSKQSECSDVGCDAWQGRRGAERRHLLCLEGDTADPSGFVIFYLLSDSSVTMIYSQHKMPVQIIHCHPFTTAEH